MTPDVRHQHLVVRAEIAKPPMGQDQRSLVEDWMRKLIADIDMKIMFGPTAMYCEVEGNRGMTAFAIIETSHCAWHSWDEPETAIAQVDVYTCSDLDPQTVIDSLAQYEPTKIEWKFLDREFDLRVVGESNPTWMERAVSAFVTYGARLATFLPR